jgi:hypothetical protein
MAVCVMQTKQQPGGGKKSTTVLFYFVAIKVIGTVPEAVSFSYCNHLPPPSPSPFLAEYDPRLPTYFACAEIVPGLLYNFVKRIHG